MIKTNFFQITLNVHCCGWEEEPYWGWSLGQRSRSSLALCIKPCWQDFYCRLSPITFKLTMKVVDDERKIPIDFGSRGKTSRSTLAQTTVFSQSLWNLTCKLFIVRAGTLLILCHELKVKVNFGTLSVKLVSMVQATVYAWNYSQTSYLSCWWWEERPFSCLTWVMRSNVVVKYCPREGMPCFALSS